MPGAMLAAMLLGTSGGAGHRYWRINITNGATGGLSVISEMELMIAGVDQIPVMAADTTSGVTLSADSVETAGREAWRAGDNSTATDWGSANTAKPHWIKVDFGVNKDITTWSVRCWASFNQYYPIDFTLDWSDDNSAWTTASTQTGQSFTANERKVYTIP